MKITSCLPGGGESFELAETGLLDRLSISPDETKICFDYHPGKTNPMPGRTLYVADFEPTGVLLVNPWRD